MKIDPLEKIFAENTDYTLENYRAIVIEKIGTNDTAQVTIRIDGKVCGYVTNYVAPLRPAAANMSDPMVLGDLRLVIPPLKAFRFDGTAGSLVNVIGTLIELLPTETLPADLAGRFAVQHTEYMVCLQGSDVSTGLSLAAGAEVSLYTLTPTTIQQYIFNSDFTVRQVAAGSAAEADGNLGVRLYFDGAPIDILQAASGLKGIRRFSLDVPGTGTNIMEQFKLDKSPVTVPGDHTFEIRVMNVTGGALFATTAATFHVYLIGRFKWTG